MVNYDSQNDLMNTKTLNHYIGSAFSNADETELAED